MPLELVHPKSIVADIILCNGILARFPQGLVGLKGGSFSVVRLLDACTKIFKTKPGFNMVAIGSPGPGQWLVLKFENRLVQTQGRDNFCLRGRTIAITGRGKTENETVLLIHRVIVKIRVWLLREIAGRLMRFSSTKERDFGEAN